MLNYTISGAVVALNEMCYARGARYDPDKKCLSGTRRPILDELISWVDSPNGDETPRVLFLTAMAGFGKSAIAHTIAHHYDGLHRLGSSYCFDQAEQANRSIKYLFSTISKDISGLDKHWQSALCSVVSGNPALCSTESVGDQFRNFIVKPGESLANVGPIVVVIDALDESGSLEQRKSLLDILVKRAADLPKHFRVLVTSRPEPDVVDIFQNTEDHKYVKHISIDGPVMESESNRLDISLYLEDRLSKTPGLEEEWPNGRWCSLLAERAEGLFQWAAVACDYINSYGGLSHVAHLKYLLKDAKGLDKLYHKVLSQAFPEFNLVKDCYRSVMGRILTAKEPLSLSTLSRMLVENPMLEEVQALIQPLGCLLSGIKNSDIPIKPVHSSLHNFLTSSESGDFYIDKSWAEKELALSTLQILNSELHFNICKIPSSYKVNDNHSINLSENISSQLLYSCIFFAEHLKMVACEDVFDKGLNIFMEKHFLSWLEVLSVTKKLDTAHDTLLKISRWLKVRDPVYTL